MRKILFLAALASSLCTASCQKGGYTISGTVNEANDGDTVCLIYPHERTVDTLALTTVKNGKFTLSGQQDSTVFAVLVYQKGQQQQEAQFLLENADIEVTMGSGGNLPEVRGTAMNEQWSSFLKKSNELNDKAIAIYQKQQAGSLSEAETDQARQELKAIEGEMTGFVKTFIADNVQNTLGQYLLGNMGEQLEQLGEDAFVEEQLAKIDMTKAHQLIRDLKQHRDEASETAIGHGYKDITAQTPDGKTLSISDVAKDAKVLMIDFWASWCGPCRQEMPNVKAAYERFHAQGFEIIGVSLDQDAEAWKKAISNLGMTWPQISDLKGWECEGAAAYSVRAIPATVLIKDGKIVARNVRGEEIAKKVEELLK